MKSYFVAYALYAPVIPYTKILGHVRGGFTVRMVLQNHHMGFIIYINYIRYRLVIVKFCGYQTKYQSQQQQRFLFILIYSSRYVQLQSG